MMMSEFIDRTGYTPTSEEYAMIEESYYDFPGNKDEFCKQWLKDKRDGHWDREVALRTALAQQKAQYEAKIAEQEDNLKFYRPYFEKAYKLEKQMAEANEKLERLERVFRRTFETK